MTLVVLAAGLGSRYGGLKQIDPVGPSGEFIIDYSCHDAVKVGFNHIVFVVKRENYDVFKETIGKRVEPYVRVSYVFQEADNMPEGRVKPWGTAHALLACKDVVKDNFAVINADDFYGYDAFKKLYDMYNVIDVNAERTTVVGYRLADTMSDNGTVNRGVCRYDKYGNLVRIDECKNIEKTAYGGRFEINGIGYTLDANEIVSMNMFGMTPVVFKLLEEHFKSFLTKLKDPLKDECLIPAVLSNAMMRGRLYVDVAHTDAQWFGVTYRSDVETVKQNIKSLIRRKEYKKFVWDDIIID